jgi:hypothetical protein
MDVVLNPTGDSNFLMLTTCKCYIQHYYYYSFLKKFILLSTDSEQYVKFATDDLRGSHCCHCMQIPVYKQYPKIKLHEKKKSDTLEVNSKLQTKVSYPLEKHPLYQGCAKYGLRAACCPRIEFC